MKVIVVCLSILLTLIIVFFGIVILIDSWRKVFKDDEGGKHDN